MSRPGVSPASLLAAVYLAVLLVCVFGAGIVAPFDPLEQAVDRRLEPPGRVHPFGTDGFGRDVWSRTLHGARTSLAVATAAVALAGLAGVVTGLTSAYAGGIVDLAVQRLVDLLLGFPFLVTALVIVVALS